MSFLEVISAIERGVAEHAKGSPYHHGVVGNTGSWRRPDRYRFAEVRVMDPSRAQLLIYHNAREIDETPFDGMQADALEQVARRIVDHLEI